MLARFSSRLDSHCSRLLDEAGQKVCWTLGYGIILNMKNWYKVEKGLDLSNRKLSGKISRRGNISLFASIFYASTCTEPGIYPRWLRTKGRGHSGWGANPVHNRTHTHLHTTLKLEMSICKHVRVFVLGEETGVHTGNPQITGRNANSIHTQGGGIEILTIMDKIRRYL